MMKQLLLISREREYELINNLLIQVDNSNFEPDNTAVVVVSPDYSSTVAMHLLHAWSKDGELMDLLSIDVPYPDESHESYVMKARDYFKRLEVLPKRLVLIEAGIIRGFNWSWILEMLYDFGYTRDEITLIALCEDENSIVKSDYVGQYFCSKQQEVAFYYERYNRHW